LWANKEERKGSPLIKGRKTFARSELASEKRWGDSNG